MPRPPTAERLQLERLLDAITSKRRAEVAAACAKGTYVNAKRGTTRWTPLHAAVCAGDLEIVRLLVSAGANRNAKDWKGAKPEAYATAPAVRKFFQSNSGGGSATANARATLLRAIERRDLAAVKASGRDVDINAAFEHDGEHTTPFWVGLLTSRLSEDASYCRLVMALVDAGGDLASRHAGRSPLHAVAGWAAGNDPAQVTAACELIAILAARGADLEAVDADGRSALWAVRGEVRSMHKGNLRLVQALVKAGADIHQRDRRSATYLEGAIADGNVALVKYLAGKGAKLPASRAAGCVNAAVRGNHMETVRVLTQLGLVRTAGARDASGQTPLIVAAIGNREAAVAELIASKVELDAQDRDGRTALHHALEHGHRAIAKQLILAGADVTLQDHLGQDIRALAREYRFTDVVATVDARPPAAAGRRPGKRGRSAGKRSKP